MNERIKELAEQAGYTEAYYESDDGPFIPAEFDKEKFAELIVKDCAEIVRDSLLPSQNKVPATVALDIAARNIELLLELKNEQRIL